MGAMDAEEASIRVFRETLPALYAFVARRVGGDHALAEDVVQEAWLRAVPAWREHGLRSETSLVSPAVADEAEQEADPWGVATGAFPVGQRTLTCADLEAAWTIPGVAEPALGAAPDLLCARL